MEIIYNEFDIPEPNPTDNLRAWLLIGNELNLLDENYKEATKPIASKIGGAVLSCLKDLRTYMPLLYFIGPSRT